MIRHAPALTTEEADLADMVGEVVAGAKERPSDERPGEVTTVRRRLAELGVWTLEPGEPSGDAGGTGEDVEGDHLAAVIFACLAQSWPALAWGSVQASVAARIVDGTRLAVTIRAGDTAVAVVDGDSDAVRLTVRDGMVSGRVDRIDPAGERPCVVVVGDGSVLVLPPEALRFERLRRTGLDGALTTSAELVEPVREAEALAFGVDTDAARVRLRLGAAAVATGIADAAAEAALAYGGQRVQFGAPLTALPTVRDTLFSASLAVTTAWRQVLRPRDCPVWQAAAVLDSACEQAIDACAAAVQSHGGYGYLTEYRVERMLRDALSLRAACDVVTARRTAAVALAGSPPPTDAGKESQ
ncbi:acyl-CoA dehydrogenase family protein [Actinomadura mexicana]|uniref:Acyl-CoA dehydrogenase, C-terminal domain n=1 Tax=Actinomadura mexicana TaxID=134959 RepID=A0A238XAE3_9ACTN|nr:acyl-CoA dehydrogenase family protein [Actinomadura mexicana]SNR56005.1 Acyl-CoA dehydrogenase, C-terminal domain [Actinomadura mexicana]